MGYYAAGKRCKSCNKPVVYTTPRGREVKWIDEKGRCSKCNLADRPTYDEQWANILKGATK
jgi:hypothetical protein